VRVGLPGLGLRDRSIPSVLWWSEVVLLDNLTERRRSSSSGVSWTVASVTFSVASSTVPSVEVIKDVDL
jgi:hypothetical protein